MAESDNPDLSPALAALVLHEDHLSNATKPLAPASPPLLRQDAKVDLLRLSAGTSVSQVLTETIRYLSAPLPSLLRELAIHVLRALDATKHHLDSVLVSVSDEEDLRLYWKHFHFDMEFYCEDEQVYVDATTRTVDPGTQKWTHATLQLAPFAAREDAIPADLTRRLAAHLDEGFARFQSPRSKDK